MTAAILILFAGYTIGSYGVVLLKGYDIPPAQWINPLNPWIWPAGKVKTVPPGQTFPGGARGAAAPPSALNPPNVQTMPKAFM